MRPAPSTIQQVFSLVCCSKELIKADIVVLHVAQTGNGDSLVVHLDVELEFLDDHAQEACPGRDLGGVLVAEREHNAGAASCFCACKGVMAHDCVFWMVVALWAVKIGPVLLGKYFEADLAHVHTHAVFNHVVLQLLIIISPKGLNGWI
jgi:hypothetical protein